MKNPILLVLTIVLVFALIACDHGNDNNNKNNGNDNNDSKKISAKIRAYNNNGVAPAAVHGARAVSLMPSAADTDYFSKYALFYDHLGSKKGDITPSKFILWLSELILFFNDGDGNSYRSRVGIGELLDFVNETNITAGEFPTDVTCVAMELRLSPQTDDSKLEFEWPGGKAAFDNHRFDFNGFDGDDYYHVGGAFAPYWDGDKVTLSFPKVDPASFDRFELQSFVLGSIALGPGEQRVYDGKNAWEEFPEFNYEGMEAHEGWRESCATIVLPFTPISIPSSASSISITLSWNLEGIISQYEGATDSEYDDYFVFKNGWWEDLYLTMSVVDTPFTPVLPSDLNGIWVNSEMGRKIVLNNGSITVSDNDVEGYRGTYSISGSNITFVYTQILGSVIAGDLGAENIGLVANQWYTEQQAREAVIQFMVNAGKSQDEEETELASMLERFNPFATQTANYTLSGNTLSISTNGGNPAQFIRQ
jgi:hypothetical protein